MTELLIYVIIGSLYKILQVEMLKKWQYRSTISVQNCSYLNPFSKLNDFESFVFQP